MEKIRPTLLRQQARTALKGLWGAGALVAFVYLVFIVVIQLLIGNLVGLFHGPVLIGPNGLPNDIYTRQIATFIGALIAAPLGVGLLFSFQDLLRLSVKPTIESVFKIFCQYGRYVVVCLLVLVYTLLWMLLLIIPGMIKALSYSMTYYIMRDNPEMSAEKAIKSSMKMMKGHKMELSLLSLSLVGWGILAAITIVGVLWYLPYVYTAQAAFYEKVKGGEEVDESL